MGDVVGFSSRRNYRKSSQCSRPITYLTFLFFTIASDAHPQSRESAVQESRCHEQTEKNGNEKPIHVLSDDVRAKFGSYTSYFHLF
jgi:hypothetical protein